MNTICFDSKDNTRILAEMKTDLFLHILAHCNINNVASNFDMDYVKYITDLKDEETSSLHEALKEINDENLVYLCFMPAFFNDIDSLFRGIDYLSAPDEVLLKGFVETETQCLHMLQNVYGDNSLSGLVTFSRIAKTEYEQFYSLYWESRRKDYIREINKFRKFWESEDNDVILAFLRTQGLPAITVYLSEGMRKNGRGMRTNNSSVCTITKTPVNDEEIFASYYIALHELLHQVIDGITQSILKIDGQQRSLNPDEEGFNIHEQMENSVIFAQHLLMKKTATTRTKEYYAVVSKIAGMDINNESVFFTHFEVDDRIRVKVESMVKPE